MTPRYLTHRDRALAEPLRQEIPGSNPAAFWRRVREGFYLPLGLFEDGTLDGLLVVSVTEREEGRELWLQLSTQPGFAEKHREPLLSLIRRLASENRCDRIVFESKRRGWQAFAEGLGFAAEPVTRYTMEVSP